MNLIKKEFEMKKKTNWRAFVSVYMGYSFLTMTITGIILYLAPAGRVAFWSNWTFLGFTKKEWEALHTLFSFVWVVIATYHIIYNWKPLMAYMRRKVSGTAKYTREFFYATIFTLIVFVGTYYEIPPFSSVMDFGEYLTESWESKETEPPVPHAELLTISEFSKTIKMPLQKTLNTLAKKGFKIPDTLMTVEEVAKLNNTSPNKLYLALNEKESSTMKYAAKRGLGRKLFSEILKENNLSWEEAIQKLKAKNIVVEKDEKLRDISEENNVKPLDILEALGIELEAK